MTEFVWVERLSIELLHSESLSEHGGLTGLRDAGLLESALGRPRNLHAYEGVDDVVTLAACYGIAIARNHPFNDGNKRAALLAMFVFAELNGLRVEADEADAAAIMLAAAADELGQDELAAWLRKQIRRT